MTAVIRFLKQIISFSNFWFKNIGILILFAILTNHLSEPENFPLHESYKFPWIPIIVSALAGIIALIIAYFNFNFFKKNYFIEKITVSLLLRFVFSTLGYVSIVFVLFYLTANTLMHGIHSLSLYNLLKTYPNSMISMVVLLGTWFGADIYKLHKFSSIKGKLKIKQGGKITFINYEDIAFFYSENKIVYLVKIDGVSIITDFTLNEIEPKISELSFFRANRQTILHMRSIEQVQSIENGKLSVYLKPTLSNKKNHQITISRYKKQIFMDWFENKIES